MSWLKSRRLRFLLGGAAVLFALFLVLRLVFVFGFSEVDLRNEDLSRTILSTLGVGARFDLRLAILLMLPLAVLAWLPRVNLSTSAALRAVGRLYLVLAIPLVLLIYIVDFGHYAYLGQRINATVFRFLGDPAISATMVWQSYPVVWIGLGWALTACTVIWIFRAMEKITLERRRQASIGVAPAILGGAVMILLTFLGILGRVDNINIKNPVPLRWSDAYFSADPKIAALGLNPVNYLFDTSWLPQKPYDTEIIAHYYPVVARYLGVDKPDITTLDFTRHIGLQPHRFATERKPNIVMVMLESLGASSVSSHGNPLNTTPNLDAIARDSWHFTHFYVPVTGTAKTVWASITGIPDVSRQETATRNPLITRQKSLINALKNYQKYYVIGGSSGWANMSSLIQNSVDGITLLEEGYWKSPNADVWGVSDLNLFKETHEILRNIPKDQPFFIYIQTAGNHRPYTIPPDNDDFKVMDIPLEEVQKHSFQTVEHFNGVRLLDYNIGRLIQMAKEGGYFDDTIFVFFGDHNTRITHINFMPPAFEQLGLEGNHVPFMIYAPKYLQPKVFDQAVGLSDVMPTLLSMAGFEYTTGVMGRDIQTPPPEGERVVPVVLREGTFPLIAGVSKDFLVQMGHDGSNPSLHDLRSATPKENVASRYPEEYQRLLDLTRGLYESAHLMFYSNVKPEEKTP